MTEREARIAAAREYFTKLRRWLAAVDYDPASPRFHDIHRASQYGDELLDQIAALHARLEAVERERDEAIRHLHQILRESMGHCSTDYTDYSMAVIGAEGWRIRCEAAERDRDAAREALELPLMFHGGGVWDESKRTRWREITGTDEATTKVMCDAIRRALTPTPPPEEDAR